MNPALIEILRRGEIIDGIICVNNYTVDDLNSLKKIDNDGLISQIHNANNELIFFEDITTGDTIDIEFLTLKLNSIGIFVSIKEFINRNRHDYPEPYYIHELGYFSVQDIQPVILKHYHCIIKLIETIEQLSEFKTEKHGNKVFAIVREKEVLVLPIIYSEKTLEFFIDETEFKIVEQVFSEIDTEKSRLFINELITFLNEVDELTRFSFLIENFSIYYQKCSNSYNYYIRNFSFNKLKFELDSKALEYTQKIQTVINESQTKLIAIPTAFVLAFSAFDFQEVSSVKNIGLIISLFIFALLIQLFLNNQKSTLSFISENIESYKETFAENEIEKISSKFSIVDQELRTQKGRLRIVQIILWIIPVGLFCVGLYLSGLQVISILSFILISTAIIQEKHNL